MDFEMFSGPSLVELPPEKWDLAIFGAATDERGEHSVRYLRDAADRHVMLSYDPSTLSATMAGKLIHADDCSGELEEWAPSSVILDATTLGIVEVALVCRAVRQMGLSSVSFLYAEPGRYHSATRRDDAYHRRDFDLTDKVVGYSAIAGFTFLLNEKRNQRCVFLLGFEGHRLDKAFEELPLVPGNCSVVLGVPAFRAGWDLDSIAGNIHYLTERQAHRELSYCPADNPLATLEYLESIYAGKEPNEDMFVAPIGTKPQSIGAIFFASGHDDVGILYDHPIRRSNWTKGIGGWHLFKGMY